MHYFVSILVLSSFSRGRESWLLCFHCLTDVLNGSYILISLLFFRHAVIVFGGVKGLEASLEADESLNVNDPTLLFHHYLNTCPNQGSRTIRSEVITN